MREIKGRTEIKARSWDGGTMHYEVILGGEESFFHGDIIMLSTGLKDRNGVEIYAGDIVEWENVYVSTGIDGYIIDGTSAVRFDAAAFEVKSLYGWHVLSAVNQECEVIGNVYQNSDLLKV